MSEISKIALSAPGTAEAELIRADYAAALSGLRAYVSMGFRLAYVKYYVPHGAYLPWCCRYLGDLSPRHLQRAVALAKNLIEMSGIKYDIDVVFETLPPEILAIIDGENDVKSLMGTVQEYRHDAAEDEASALCRVRWNNNAILRDEWEPKVLSGAITHILALRGMDGQATAGLPRGQQQAGQLLFRDVTSMAHNWKHWDTIPPLMQTRFFEELPTVFLGAPPSVLDALESALAAARSKLGSQGDTAEGRDRG